jgi:predicted oxidoreductase (fatty acid repression mutant protein)
LIERLQGIDKISSNVPESWKLEAQLVFGEMVEGPGPEKERTGLEESLRVFGGGDPLS